MDSMTPQERSEAFASRKSADGGMGDTVQQLLDAEVITQAQADAIKMLNEANANDAVLKIKAMEAFAKAANGQATKIIIPSEIQSVAGLAEGIVEAVKK